MRHIRLSWTILAMVTLLGSTSLAYDQSITHPVSGERIEVGPVRRGPVSGDLKQSLATPVLKPAQLDSAIRANMLKYHIQGVSACAFIGDSIVWEGNYGYADSAGLKPVTGATLFELASISKTFIANAVLQLSENGLINLDLDVNGYLPFPLRNCYYPDAIITPRMLLAHVSSIDRKDQNWGMCPGTDCSTPLVSYLQDYLVPGGSRYNCTNYLNAPPGDTGVYCNWAFAVLGVLIEQVTGQTLEQYCQNSLFLPLGMTNSSWFLADLDTADIAMPLWWSTTVNRYRSYGHYGIPIYPCGQLRTSSRQLARHFAAFLGYGETGGVRILDSATVEQMQITQYPDAPLYPWVEWVLGWFQVPSYGGGWVWGHDGSLWGAATAMFGSVEERTGYVMLSNVGWNDGLSNQIEPLIEVFSRDVDQDGVIAGLDNCPGVYNPGQEDTNHDGIGDVCCCFGRVGDANGSGDEPTIGDISTLIDAKFITGTCDGILPCLKEADINLSGGTSPTCDDITIGDISMLIDYLFITGSEGMTLPPCL